MRDRSIGVVSNRDGRWLVGCNYCRWYEVFDTYSEADEERHKHRCSEPRVVVKPENKFFMVCPKCHSDTEFGCEQDAVLAARQHRSEHRAPRPLPALKELVRIAELAQELAISESDLRELLVDMGIELLPMQRHLGINDATTVRHALGP